MPPFTPRKNELYLAVLPLVHYSKLFSGERYEEVMTLVPDREFATEFSTFEVHRYIHTFENAVYERYAGRQFDAPYNFEKVDTSDDRCYVVVTQNVRR